MEKPIAELTITVCANGNHKYRIERDGELLFITHALPTVVGRDGARSRMQRWLARHPCEVRMVGVAPEVAATATDDQEIAFWRQFELVLGGRTWARVEQALGNAQGAPAPRPTTLAGWNKLFEQVDQALRRQEAVA